MFGFNKYIVLNFRQFRDFLAICVEAGGCWRHKVRTTENYQKYRAFNVMKVFSEGTMYTYESGDNEDDGKSFAKYGAR